MVRGGKTDMMKMRGITRYVDDLLRSRRPRAFEADEDDAAIARAAITLRAARPGCGAPTEEFVTGLHKRLAAELETPVPAPDVVRRPRRSFVRAASVAAGAAAAGAGIDHLLGSGGGAAGAGGAGGQAGPAATIEPDHGTWQTVLASAELPDGAVLPFVLSALIGFVERTEGQLRAVSGVCTHQGCRLMLDDGDAELMCPCHGARFALDGAVLHHRLSFRLTALPMLEVREADGVIQVFAPRP
jgi:cytochrome b6-f complex iron-sulfur subunit